MSCAVDTNTVIALLAGAPDLAQRAASVMTELSNEGALVISPVVYAELLAGPARDTSAIDEFLAATHVTVDWSIAPAVWHSAGLAFRAYAARRRHSGGGPPRRLLADFLIGAQALATGALLTLDPDFYRVNFPDLRVITF